MPSVDKTGIATGQSIQAEHITRIADAVESYTLKGILITGEAGSPNEVIIVPGAVGANKVLVDNVGQGVLCYGSNGEKAIPSFTPAANYTALTYDIKIISQQEQEVKMDFTSGYPFVNGSGQLVLKLYKSGIGAGYGGGTDCLCTLVIGKN